MLHRGLQPIIVYSNDDPRVSLTDFTARINLVILAFLWEKSENSGFLAHLSRRLKGELIVYRSIRRPCVSASVRLCVNIFKLEYLRNQWANRNQILSEASLGWGIDCIRFWTR